jgi:hypothetical protein
MLTRSDVNQFVIGPQRRAFGDLWNTRIDVKAVGGTGGWWR